MNENDRARTIGDVIIRLDAILEASRRDRSRLGYFPALYRQVTVAVRDGIRAGDFEDGERLERLDVIFANRYLEAYEVFERGDTPTQSWQRAFEATAEYWPIVLQHLLLGINAHINLDLGIAAAQTSPGNAIDDLKTDFDRINGILGSMIDEVEARLSRLFPLLAPLDWVGGRTDEAIIGFALLRARDEAWNLATTLAKLKPEEQEAVIDRADQNVAALAQRIRRPGFLITAATRFIRVCEPQSVPRVLQILTQ